MRYAIHVFAIGLIIILESVFSGAFSHPTPLLPSVIVSVALARTYIYGFDDAILWILVVGLIGDIALSATFGSSLLALLLISYFLSIFTRRAVMGTHTSGRLLLTLYVLTATFLYWNVHFFATVGVASSEQYIEWLVPGVMPVIWQGILSFVVFWGTLFLMKKLGMRKSMTIGRMSLSKMR